MQLRCAGHLTAFELLGPFADSISGLNLVPGAHGVFDVKVNDDVVLSARAAQRFPEIEELVDPIQKHACLSVEYKK